MTSELLSLPALELARLLREGDASPVEVARASLERCRADNERLNAYCFFDEDRTLEHARAAEARLRAGAPASVLDGVPYAVKDTLFMRGWPTRKGSRTMPETPADFDSPCIAALNDAGCVPIGKTTTPEFGWKGVTDSPAFGVTRNPHDPTRTTGGSSGGSAATVAAFGVPLATGTDSGGSIRMPAAFCGIVGHKPTYGTIPWYTPTPLGRVTHAGPMTRNVRDACEMLRIMARRDPRDTVLPPVELGVLEPTRDLRGMRIAFDARCEGLEDDVRENFERTLELLARAGAILVEAWPFEADTAPVFDTIYYAGLAHVLAGYDARQRAGMDPDLVDMALQGSRIRIEEYLDAQVKLNEFRAQAEVFHEHHDFLLTPALPITAFEAGREVPEGWHDPRWTSWTPFTWPFNLTGQPALTIPNGRSAAGLPTGVQIVGPRHADTTVLAHGAALEALIEDAGTPEATEADFETV